MNYEIIERHYDHPVFQLLDSKINYSVVLNRVHLKFAETIEECQKWISENPYKIRVFRQ